MHEYDYITVTITDPHNGHLKIKSNNRLFKESFGEILLDAAGLYKQMIALTDWANNEHGVGILFEAE